MQTNPDKLTKKHEELTHTDLLKVVSHTQREKDEWFINSIMVEGVEVPFKFKRKQPYRTLNKGQRVNMTYYPQTEKIAGLEFEIMKVVRIKTS